MTDHRDDHEETHAMFRSLSALSQTASKFKNTLSPQMLYHQSRRTYLTYHDPGLRQTANELQANIPGTNTPQYPTSKADFEMMENSLHQYHVRYGNKNSFDEQSRTITIRNGPVGPGIAQDPEKERLAHEASHGAQHHAIMTHNAGPSQFTNTEDFYRSQHNVLAFEAAALVTQWQVRENSVNLSPFARKSVRDHFQKYVNLPRSAYAGSKFNVAEQNFNSLTEHGYSRTRLATTNMTFQDLK
jgi:hypothetical protein